MKPDQTLHQLDREPLVYFGCTWTEIKAALHQSGAAAVIVLVGLVMLLRSPVVLALVLVGWLALAYALLHRIHRFRAGKPLYFERHRKTVSGAAFIKAGRRYQYSRRARRGPPASPHP
ncbi:MAG: DUF3487 family protein [Candidatus Competibacteraceae bacterium]|nr:DUF3487 family protein [Candidatus Competibacteraceae bacterium]